MPKTNQYLLCSKNNYFADRLLNGDFKANIPTAPENGSALWGVQPQPRPCSRFELTSKRSTSSRNPVSRLGDCVGYFQSYHSVPQAKPFKITDKEPWSLATPDVASLSSRSKEFNKRKKDRELQDGISNAIRPTDVHRAGINQSAKRGENAKMGKVHTLLLVDDSLTNNKFSGASGIRSIYGNAVQKQKPASKDLDKAESRPKPPKSKTAPAKPSSPGRTEPTKLADDDWVAGDERREAHKIERERVSEIQIIRRERRKARLKASQSQKKLAIDVKNIANEMRLQY